MAELPKSWGLKAKKRDDGKLDIVGKDDSGKEYKVRTTDAPEVTPKDIAEIAAVDRDRTTAKEFIGSLIAEGKKREQERELSFQDDLSEAACELVGKVKTKRGPGKQLSEMTGSSRAFRRGWEAMERGKLWWELKEESRQENN